MLDCYVRCTRRLDQSAGKNLKNLSRAGRDISVIEKRTFDDPEDISAELDIIRGLLAGNTSTSSNLLMQGLARIAIQENRLPPADEIARRLKADLPRWLLLSMSIMPVLTEQRIGRDLAEKRRKHLLQRLPSPVPHFGLLLDSFVRTGEIDPVAPELIKYFRTVPPEIPQRPSQPKGFCAAQFPYQPYKAPGSMANRQRAEAWFARHGVPLTNGAYSGALFQLVRGIEAGQRTIFADPDYREACEALVSRN